MPNHHYLRLLFCDVIINALQVPTICLFYNAKFRIYRTVCLISKLMAPSFVLLKKKKKIQFSSNTFNAYFHIQMFMYDIIPTGG